MKKDQIKKALKAALDRKAQEKSAAIRSEVQNRTKAEKERRSRRQRIATLCKRAADNLNELLKEPTFASYLKAHLDYLTLLDCFGSPVTINEKFFEVSKETAETLGTAFGLDVSTTKVRLGRGNDVVAAVIWQLNDRNSPCIALTSAGQITIGTYGHRQVFGYCVIEVDDICDSAVRALTKLTDPKLAIELLVDRFGV